MVLRNHSRRLIDLLYTSTILGILFCVFALPAQVQAKDVPDTFPSLTAFIETVKDGNASVLRGVYVQNVMAFPIVQQPARDDIFVSADPSVVTQFNLVKRTGNVGLLAHNYLAGKSFSNIKVGDQIILIYGDGHLEGFEMKSALRYQTLDPLNPYSHFKDLESRTILTSEQLFNKVYRGKYHLTLQTCFENEGNLSWGMLFIIAKPVDNEDINLEVHPTTMTHVEDFPVR